MANEIIIDVRSAAAFVARKRGRRGGFTYEPCANWRQLAPLAVEAVQKAGGGVTLSGIYPCPDALANLALWAEDILFLVTTPAEAEAEYGLGHGTPLAAVERGDVRGRQAGKTWLLYRPDVAEQWGE